jgi:hypothetical protein
VKKRLSFILLIVGLIGLLGNGFAKEKENFRFRVLYQFVETPQPELSSRDNLWIFRKFEEGFGNWAWYIADYISGLGFLATYTPLKYKSGDTVPLRWIRSGSSEQVGRNFGFELEGRIFKTLWLGLAYNQNPSFLFNITEEEEVMVLEKFQELPNEEGYHVYYMELSRKSVVHETNVKFSSSSCQVYAKGEISQDFFQMFGGIGIDFFSSIQKVIRQEQIRPLMPWSGNLIVSEPEITEPTKSTDTNWLIRPLMTVGVQVRIIQKLSLGAQAKILPKGKSLQYKKDYLLPLAGDCPKYWTIVPSDQVISLFLTFNF